MSAPIRHRVFFTFLPPSGPRGVIAQLGERLHSDGQHVRYDRLHLTLSITIDFDELPPSIVDSMKRVGDEITEAPQPILLDQVSGSNRSIVLRPSRTPRSLKRFEKELERRALARRVPLHRRPFSPHVTMLYRPGRPFTRLTDPIGWTATELVLLHSAVGATRHTVLGRWPLQRREEEGGEQLSLFD